MRASTLFPLEPGSKPGSTAAAAAPATTPSPAPSQAPAPPPLPAGRAVDLAALESRTALVRQQVPPGSGRAPWFDWSANPYRGCEFGCGYCYARPTHEWLGHSDPRAFQERIYVKSGFAAALRRDLAKVRPGEHVAFGTATDPYQPIERREEVMRAALRELARTSGIRVSITTKSSLVARDVALLRAVAEQNAVHVNFTITTPDARLARFLEPRAPAPAARFGALRALRAAGISAGVFVMPLLPGVTDAEADLRALVRSAARAGALWAAHQTLVLDTAPRAHFLPLLRRAYPRAAARYELWTRTSRLLPAELRERVGERFRAIVREAGLEPGASGCRLPLPAGAAQRTFEFVA